jgi:hypothetical protein
MSTRSRRKEIRLALAVAGALSASWALQGQRRAAPDPQFFVRDLYPAFEAAGCRGCHSEDGVASTTRLRFPPKGAPPEQIRAFGLRLDKLVDRGDPRQSLLLLKPTNRTAHTGGERVHPGSQQETALTAWVEYLAGSTAEELGAELKKIPSYRPAAESGPPIRRLTHSQYNRTVRDLLGVLTRPARRFPPEDYVNGFKNQAAGQMMSPTLSEAYGAAAENLAASVFRYGASGNLIPCKAEGPQDAGCAERFIRQFGRRAFRRPLEEKEAARFKQLFLAESRKSGIFLKGAQIVVEAMLLDLARPERGSAPQLRRMAGFDHRPRYGAVLHLRPAGGAEPEGTQADRPRDGAPGANEEAANARP